MSSISLISNLFAQRALRALARNASDQSRVQESLASGSRINRASDDAAGLSIAMRLQSSARVYTQGIRNVNDGISLLNIAQGAGQELSGVLMRLKELATQAANGSLSLTQRKSLDTEAYQLQQEFNRITATTQFNGRSLLNGNFGGLRIQAGFGVLEGLNFNLGADMSRKIGNGRYSADNAIALLGASSSDVAAADFNNDGFSDFAFGNYGGGGSFRIYMGNGAGGVTFGGGIAGGGTNKIVVGDINNDNNLDLVLHDGAQVRVATGKGDGSFNAPTTFVSTSSMSALGDVNNDGNLDFIGRVVGSIEVRLGTGTGTFGAATSIAFAGTGDLALSDLNNDGNLDIAAVRGGAIGIFNGNGQGGFAAGASYVSGAGASQIQIGDMDHDGDMDLVVGGAANVVIHSGNGDATFASATVLLANALSDLRVADLTGDGNLDIWGLGAGNTTSLIGNGAGQFNAAITSAIGATASTAELTDVNNDGALDVFFTDMLFTGQSYIKWAQTSDSTTLARLDLTTQGGALGALGVVQSAMDRVLKELGNIGASLSRMESAKNTLENTTTNYEMANSRITDTDISEQAAEMVRHDILQQTAAAILAQANQIPALALKLLSAGSPPGAKRRRG